MKIGIVFAILLAGCGGSQLSAADQESIARDGIEIAVCQSEGKACKADAGPDAQVIAATCWPVYDKCMQSAGLKDGGK